MEKQTVCFTGTCPNMTRDELTQKASEKYDVLSSVTKNLDILVCADPNANSTKLQKAAKNGTKIISYDEFIETLDAETSNEFLTFSDFNFKLVIINELMYEQDLLPKFDVYEFAKNYTQRKIDIDSEGYEPIPEVIEYFKNLQIPSNLADSITELCMDGGDEIHHQIIPFWDGEDEYFDVNQVTKEDLVQFKNLKEATLMIKNFEENKKIFKAQNIKLIDFLNDDFDDDFDDSEENLENEETENDDSNSENDELDVETKITKKIINRLTKDTGKFGYIMNFDSNKKASIFDSKLRGVPYWDLSKEYPTDKKGNKMLLVAQVNFSKENLDENDDLLPKQGILQFFHTNSVEYFYPDETDYKIVYHKTIDESVTEKQILDLDIPMVSSACYIRDEISFSLEKTISAINHSVNGYENCVEKVISELLEDESEKNLFLELLEENGEVNEFGEPIEDLEEVDSSDIYGMIDDNINDNNIEEYHSNSSSMLGYPEFTQDDPRKENSTYDTLLFKFDSCSSHKIEIGDSGVANIFINSEKLRNLDFSDTFYTWDCC